jgi:2-keto-3-deoxy-galactonokinase
VHVWRVVSRAPSDIAVVLAGMPDVVAALVRDHVPDARSRCIACGMPGTGTPYLPWPCPLRRIADAARQLRAGGLR